MNKAIKRSEKVYSFLLKFYPKNYRQEFEEEMKYVFSESLKETYKKQGIVTFWKDTLLDTGKSLITEHIESQRGGDSMTKKSALVIQKNKDITAVLAITAFILMIPLVAMQFTSDVDWKLFDFIIMGALLLFIGFLFVFLARKVKSTTWRIAIGVILFVILFLTWAELAVGLFGTPFAGS